MIYYKVYEDEASPRFGEAVADLEDYVTEEKLDVSELVAAVLEAEGMPESAKVEFLPYSFGIDQAPAAKEIKYGTPTQSGSFYFPTKEDYSQAVIKYIIANTIGESVDSIHVFSEEEAELLVNSEACFEFINKACTDASEFLNSSSLLNPYMLKVAKEYIEDGEVGAAYLFKYGNPKEGESSKEAVDRIAKEIVGAERSARLKIEKIEMARLEYVDKLSAISSLEEAQTLVTDFRKEMEKCLA